MVTQRLAAGVALGAVIGATGRWAIVAAAPTTEPTWSLLLVNALGCLILGAVVGRADHQPHVAVTAGLCGALTTFAALAVETAALLDDRRWLLAGTFLASSLATSAAGFVAGNRVGWRWQRC